MNFNLGNAIKYIWRASRKNGTEDLEKAIWYLKDEIARGSKTDTVPEKTNSDFNRGGNNPKNADSENV